MYLCTILYKIEEGKEKLKIIIDLRRAVHGDNNEMTKTIDLILKALSIYESNGKADNLKGVGMKVQDILVPIFTIIIVLWFIWLICQGHWEGNRWVITLVKW